jgi:hypothetical protein
MTNKLAASFVRCAVGPLHYAGGCLLSGKVPEGLRELAAESLHGGFKRGVEEAAKDAGVSVADVEHLLPIGDVNLASVHLDTAHRSAIAAWDMYAGQLGGLMTGVADLTVDGRAPDPSSLLERLSKKVVRDPALADPLHALSVEVGCWSTLVDQCGDLLANGEVLAKAYRARRIRRVLLGVVAAIGLLALLPAGLWLRAVRARVDAALAAPDPCAALDIAPRDLERATTAQRQRADDRRTACQQRRAQDAEAAEAARQHEDAVRREESAKQDRVARCDALATHVAGGEVQPDDAAAAAGQGPLLLRVARRALVPADMATTELPCADTPAGARLDDALATAVVASQAAWVAADDVSDRVASVLVAHASELPLQRKFALLAHAEKLVKRALIQKTPAAVDQATRLCKLKDDLQIRGARYCPALAALKAQGKL